MKNFAKIIIFSCLLLAGSNIAAAETISIGSFSSLADANAKLKDTSLKVNGTSYVLSKTDILSWLQEKNDLIYKSGYKSEIENGRICKYQKSIICELTSSVNRENHIQKSSVLFLDTNLITKFVDDLARQADKDPINAKLNVENGKVSVFSLSQKGVTLDKEKSVAFLADYFTQKKSEDSIDLPYTQKDPEISTDSITNLGITSLVGEGISNFARSPANRIANIKVGTSRFNGVLIKPGENFSFLKTLGDVDKEHGYLPELVIKGNITEPDYGGGICQVSTTAFRAAVNSGLKITARTPHAYPVGYYNPQGMDATVFIPSPDLKFTNNTPNYILIQTKITGTQLTFDFYGTDDGRKTDIIGPTITEREPDGSMKATFTEQVKDKSGNLILNDVFNSNYNSPYKYPHPGAAPLTTKPSNWSRDEWKQYKKDNKQPQ